METIERDTPMTTDSSNEVIQVGNIVDDSNIGFKNPQRGRVYSADGLSPCICDGSGGGGRETKIIEPIGCAMRGRNPENPSERGRSNGKYKQRIEMGSNISNTITSVQKDALAVEPIIIDDTMGYEDDSRIYNQYSPALRSERSGLKVAEPNVLTPKRTAFGKQVRKQYESGELDMSRHDMTELEPRTDGVSNTLTSVQKDNLLAEPLRIPEATKQGYIEVPQGAVFDMSYPESTTCRGRVQDGDRVSPTLMAGGEAPCYFEGVSEEWKTIIGNKQMNPFRGDVEEIAPCITSACGAGGGMTPMLTDAELEISKTKDFIEQVRGHQPMNYRIRKLTPRECFRLMGVSESDIDKIQQSGVSQSQQYKMAGNSIVCDVLYHILRKLFIEKQNENQQLTLF